MRNSSIQEKILKTVIKLNVSKKLNDTEEELSELIKGMATKADVKEAKLILLEIVMEACGEFYEKMKAKIKNGP